MVYNDTINCGTHPDFTKDSLPSDCYEHGFPTIPQGNRSCDDAGVLKKRFFGSISLSRGFHQWATEGLERGLQELFVRKAGGRDRKDRAHRIKCGGDAMFHAGKGMVGLKVDFAANVTVENVRISDITNTADAGGFLCENTIKFYPNKGTLNPGIKDYAGADVRGAVLAKTYNVLLSNITVDGIYSLQGRVIGVDLLGPETAVALVEPNADVAASRFTIKDVRVLSNITAGQRGYAIPFNSDVNAIDMGPGGFSSEQAPNLQVRQPPLDNSWYLELPAPPQSPVKVWA